MTRILLINPNTSQATTDMMVAIAQSALADGCGSAHSESQDLQSRQPATQHSGSQRPESQRPASQHPESRHPGAQHPVSQDPPLRCPGTHAAESGAAEDERAKAARAGSTGLQVVGATARRGVPMIVDAAALTAAADEVVELGMRYAHVVCGIIVSAFGDPGLACLRRNVTIPVVGIAEAAMLEAAGTARRFGVATITPELVGPIDARAAALGLTHLYTGVRLTSGDPTALAADPERLVEALADVVLRCIRDDRAEAVAIGGGPLGNAATALAPRFTVPVIAPIPAAVRRLMGMLR